MYEELIKSLRLCADSVDPIAECCYEDCLAHKGEFDPMCMGILINKAAKAIEELIKGQKHLSEQVAKWQAEVVKGDCEAWLSEQNKPRWIPVTEALPDEGKFVLVYGDLYPNKHDGGYIAVSKRMDWNYWQGFGRERNITHWMPLPEPPKEDT